MLNIIKNIFKILFKRKSTTITAVILPIGLIFFFTMLYGSTGKTNVAIINNDKGILGDEIISTLKESGSFNIIKKDSDEGYVEELTFHKYEMLIVIEDDFSEKITKGEKSNIRFEAITKGEIIEIMKTIINNEVKSLALISNNIDINENNINEIIKSYNNSKPEINVTSLQNKRTINSNIGMIFYLIFIISTFSSGFLMEDEKQGTKDRILMGKVNEKQYLGSMMIVFIIIALIPVIEHFIICNLLNFEFGFSEKYMLLILGFLMVILSISFNVMLSSIIKHKSSFSTISSIVSVPIFMLSGAFWDFKFMSENLQKVGNAIPIRWISLSIENLEKGLGIGSIIPYCIGVILISILLFLLSIFFTKNKIILIKDTTK